MSAATVATASPSGALASLREVVDDSIVVARRNLTHLVRLPQLLMFATVQPILFVLMFAYVFGGALGGEALGATGSAGLGAPGIDYVDFLMPGIFVQTVAFGAVQTGIGLAEDAQAGLIERFRTLPMRRSALLAGRTLSDLVRNLGVVLLMIGVGSLIGFDATGGFAGAVGGIAVVLLFAFAMSWVAAWVGLLAKDAETTQAGMFPVLFPLVFASSAFVPTATMPGWMQAWANNQPFSKVVDSARALFLGGPVAMDTLLAVAWSLGLIAVFAPLAVRAYRNL